MLFLFIRFVVIICVPSMIKSDIVSRGEKGTSSRASLGDSSVFSSNSGSSSYSTTTAGNVGDVSANSATTIGGTSPNSHSMSENFVIGGPSKGNIGGASVNIPSTSGNIGIVGQNTENIGGTSVNNPSMSGYNGIGSTATGNVGGAIANSPSMLGNFGIGGQTTGNIGGAGANYPSMSENFGKGGPTTGNAGGASYYNGGRKVGSSGGSMANIGVSNVIKNETIVNGGSIIGEIGGDVSNIGVNNKSEINENAEGCGSKTSKRDCGMSSVGSGISQSGTLDADSSTIQRLKKVIGEDILNEDIEIEETVEVTKTEITVDKLDCLRGLCKAIITKGLPYDPASAMAKASAIEKALSPDGDSDNDSEVTVRSSMLCKGISCRRCNGKLCPGTYVILF